MKEIDITELDVEYDDTYPIKGIESNSKIQITTSNNWVSHKGNWKQRNNLKQLVHYILYPIKGIESAMAGAPRWLVDLCIP